MESRSLKRVGLIGSYLPRPCGIATFTNDVFKSLKAARPDWELSVLAINDSQQDYDYPEEVRFVIEPTADGYARAAAFLKASQYDAIFLQHEFGLFGGLAGDRIFGLLDRVRTPLVTMFHTILEKPDEHQFRVTRQLAARSSHLITMSPRGEEFLSDVYDVDQERISVLPHGIPDVAFIDPIFYKEELGLLGRQVALTFGLLSPGKGIEYAIEALPRVVAQHPNLIYVIVGATHPNLVQQEGEKYRESLQAKVAELGMQDHVRFVNQFVELEELTHYLCAADVYLTPYLNQAQITSGTLAYAYGCGNAVISTPYWYAEDMLADGRGRLVAFRDAEQIANAMNELLSDEIMRSRIRKAAYLEGRQMTWPVVSQQMAGILESAHNQMFTHVDPRERSSKSVTTRASVSADELRVVDRLLGAMNGGPNQLTQSLSEVVEIKLDHLVALSDDVGLVQHASYQIPNWHEGYCTDDNTRGILLTLGLERLGFRHAGLAKLSRTYRAFLNYAIEPTSFAVRNFMGFDRRWLEECGSDDSLGRVAWTLGACVDTADDLDTESWATGLFDNILSQTLACSSPRTWAFGILGAAHYQNHFAGECRSREAIRDFSSRLKDLYSAVQGDDWRWFEDVVAYDNARMPQAMLVAGRVLDDDELTDIGLQSLNWLCSVQKTPQGFFRPVGNNGFYLRDQQLPAFDQQPLEAWATVSACLEALKITNESSWRREADLALAWFLGCNDLRTPIAKVATGACHDGLQYDRVNRNQGAESTLAWLMAACEWLTATNPPVKAISRATRLRPAKQA